MASLMLFDEIYHEIEELIPKSASREEQRGSGHANELISKGLILK
jgi:hypothetical protein